eukprot:scaffold119742_cov40-Tisochrysis_lutea.AAC.1
MEQKACDGNGEIIPPVRRGEPPARAAGALIDCISSLERGPGGGADCSKPKQCGENWRGGGDAQEVLDGLRHCDHPHVRAAAREHRRARPREGRRRAVADGADPHRIAASALPLRVLQL